MSAIMPQNLEVLSNMTFLPHMPDDRSDLSDRNSSFEIATRSVQQCIWKLHFESLFSRLVPETNQPVWVMIKQV
jgi:hypothetical protein